MFKILKEKLNSKFKIEIGGPIEGEVVSLKEVPDLTFSEEILGKGIAIKPINGRVVAPEDGVVDVIFETNHAVSLVTDKGVEILIHIGIDTVKLKGEYFKGFVTSGEKVKAGQILIEFELEEIKEKGYDTICPIVVCNTGDFSEVKGLIKGKINELDSVIEIKK